MVFEYILKKQNLDPATDMNIDQSIDFGSTAAAFSGGQGDFTVEFEPGASTLEKEGKAMWWLLWAWIPAMYPTRPTA